MQDLISRSALLEALNKLYMAALRKTAHSVETIYELDHLSMLVKEAPAVDAEVVRHGKWEAVKNTGLEEWCAPPIRCSNCGKTMPDVGADFCPFCGQMNAEVHDVPQD